MEPTCFECGSPATESHHVVPQSLGGTRTVSLCHTCHDKVHNDGTRNDSISALTRAAHARRKREGKRVGALPYGFKLSDDGETLELKPDEALTVRTILDLREQGASLRVIAAYLTEHNIAPRGTRWHLNTLARIVRADHPIHARIRPRLTAG